MIRIYWTTEERLSVVEAAARHHMLGADLLDAINRAQNVLPESRRRIAGSLSQTPPDVVAAIVERAAALKLDKVTSDLRAAEALLTETSAALTAAKARTEELEQRCTEYAAQVAAASPRSMLVNMLVEAGRIVMRDAIVELRAGNATDQAATFLMGEGGSWKGAIDARLRILIVAGSEESAVSDAKWASAVPSDVALRIERARADGRVHVARGFDAALLVDGVRHVTSDLVRALYPHTRMVQRVKVAEALRDIITARGGK